MNLFGENIPAIVQQAELTQAQHEEAYRSLESNNKWDTGYHAAQWKKKAGLRDGWADEFAARVGDSTETVQQRARVWETYHDVRKEYPNLSWSHFYVSLAWEDSAECLQWANENVASVPEMKAWRRAQHGEDLTAVRDELTDEGELVNPPIEYKKGDIRPVLPPGPTGKRPYIRKQAEPADPNLLPSLPPLVAAQGEDAMAGRGITEEVVPSVDKVVMTIRELMRKVEQYAEEEERQEIGEEMVSWVARLAPQLLQKKTGGELVAAVTQGQIVIQQWNLVNGVTECTHLTPNRRKTLQKCLNNDAWKASWERGLETLRRLLEKHTDWHPTIDWFMGRDTLRYLAAGRFEDGPPGTKRVDCAIPTLAEVKEYRRERGTTSFTAEQFFDHYQANGWVQGNQGKPVKDWRACFRTWEYSRKNGRLPMGHKPTTIGSVDETFERMADQARADGILGDEHSADITEDELPW